MKISRLQFASSLAGSALALGALKSGAAGAAEGQKLSATMYGSHLGIKGPDGLPHDVMIPSNFVIKAGVPVTLTVVNYDEGPHTITATDADLNLLIKGGKEQPDKSVLPVTTTFNFTIAKKGVYRWYCALPCDAKHGSWDMKQGYSGPDKEGFMAGFIVVQ